MHGRAHLQQAVDVEVADVVGAADAAAVVWRPLVVATGVVVLLVDAGDAADADAPKVDDSRGPHVEDVGRRPPSIVKLVEVVCSLMVPTNCGTNSMLVCGIS